ncbi:MULTISPECIES: hypothetical protein [Caproicibacterium]|jgi:hypothetical protein|uniref:Uncharacterized protein n=1 Tax=Caproicibacterium lactatifermentans TaxID=2666138 RepID=A0A859DP77_9FIRM|nr:hypothetical protein [Caproicibacterium lactatifermentans]QKN23618.1 hypothetical protein GJQ69_03455 [Caproicibacterium lactatifermentans]
MAKKQTVQRIFSVVLALTVITSLCIAVPASAADTDTSQTEQSVSSNLSLSSTPLVRTAGLDGSSYYGYYANSDQVYYYADPAGQLRIVINTHDPATGNPQLDIRTCNSACQQISREFVSLPLPLFGGFYHDEDTGDLYVVTGQSNSSESQAITAVEVDKYNSSWKLLSSAKIPASFANIFQGIRTPFNEGNCRMTKAGSHTLVVYMSGEMFTVEGEHQQSDLTFYLDTNTMKACQSEQPYNSHSFNQFVQYDKTNGMLKFVSHGDASPRAICTEALRWNNTTSQPIYYSSTKPFTFLGDTSISRTDTQVNGFELGRNNDLIVGTSVPHNQAVCGVIGWSKSGVTNQNLYLIKVSKDGTQSTFQWLTNNNPKASGLDIDDPRLVKINDDLFLILYTEVQNSGGSPSYTTKYMLINSSGKQLAPASSIGRPGSASNMYHGGSQPILYDGKITWADEEDGQSSSRIYQLQGTVTMSDKKTGVSMVWKSLAAHSVLQTNVSSAVDTFPSSLSAQAVSSSAVCYDVSMIKDGAQESLNGDTAVLSLPIPSGISPLRTLCWRIAEDGTAQQIQNVRIQNGKLTFCTSSLGQFFISEAKVSAVPSSDLTGTVSVWPGQIINFRTFSTFPLQQIVQGNGKTASVNAPFVRWSADTQTAEQSLYIPYSQNHAGDKTGIYVRENGTASLLFTVKLDFNRPFTCDTGSDVVKESGQTYFAKLTVPHGTEVGGYAAGNGAVALTRAKNGGAPTVSKDGKTDIYYYGFTAARQGRTGLYANIVGTKFCLYSTTVQ